MVELIFQKDRILDLENENRQLQEFFLFLVTGNLMINKVSGNQYLQYNDKLFKYNLVTFRKIKFRKTI